MSGTKVGTRSRRGPVALLTDFGERDGFVGAMKGAALAVNPDLTFVDIAHEVAPQGILEGALILASVFPVFPEGTIFVAVVDPGVGSERRILAARAAGRILLAPDNGILWPLLSRERAQARAVAAERFFRSPVHPTFHGRDILAPVAAHLSLGVPVEELGPAVEDPVALEVPRPRPDGDGLAGLVLHVDRFGNVVTNLTPGDLAPLGGETLIEVGGREVAGISRSYAGGEPLKAVIGSWGYVEVVLRGGSAAEVLGARPWSPVRASRRGGRA